MFIATRLQGLRVLQIAAGTLASFVLFWTWLWIVSMLRGQIPPNLSRYATYSILLSFGFLIDFVRATRWEVKENATEKSRLSAAALATEQTITTFLLLSVFVLLFKDLTISRLFLFTFLPLQALLLYFVYLLLPPWLAVHVFRGGRKQRTLLMGELDSISRILPWLSEKASVGIEVIGALLPPNEKGDRLTHLKYLGTFESLIEVMERERPTVVMSVGPIHNGAGDLDRLKAACESQGVRLVLASDLGRTISSNASFYNSAGIHLISLRPEPLESPANRFLKRMVDVVVSTIVIVLVLPPLALLVWVMHRIQSRGPLIYRQSRTGLHNQEFVLYKFRTMSVDNPDPSRQASRHDARVFSAGRWLRRTGLDELPQFVNVFLGEMSIVGPRPHLADHDVHFSGVDQRYRVRQIVKPGITGLAQIKGHRGEAGLPEKVIERVSADLEYLENWSFGLDVRIMARTAVHLVKAPATAY
jgi:putative colanic acid biosynthesis UDP-glucose lipid carrier transferase